MSINDYYSQDLDPLLRNTNEQYNTSSILIGDFNAKCLKWCSADKTNRVIFELDNITTITGYRPFINKPAHFVNDMCPCTDLFFYYNTSLVKSSKLGAHNSPKSPDIGLNSDGGISDFRISGKPLHNSKNSDDVDRKHGPVTKHNRRNKTSSKN